MLCSASQRGYSTGLFSFQGSRHKLSFCHHHTSEADIFRAFAILVGRIKVWSFFGHREFRIMRTIIEAQDVGVDGAGVFH